MTQLQSPPSALVLALIGRLRTLLFVVCGALFLYNGTKFLIELQPTPTERATASPYVVRFCDLTHEQDFQKKSDRQITIVLHPGCFDGPYKLPLAWDEFHVQHSKTPGEWFAVWCNGSSAPRFLKLATQDFQYGDMSNCLANGDPTTNFYAEGQGTMTFRALRFRPGFEERSALRESTEATSDSSPPQEAAKLTPTNPLSGQPRDYNITVEECSRRADDIACWGYVTNITDATLIFDLRGGQFVDSDGNTSWLNTNINTGRLVPNAKTRFDLKLNDSHRHPTSVSLEIHTSAAGDAPNSTRYDSLTFKDIPLQ